MCFCFAKFEEKLAALVLFGSPLSLPGFIVSTTLLSSGLLSLVATSGWSTSWFP